MARPSPRSPTPIVSQHTMRGLVAFEAYLDLSTRRVKGERERQMGMVPSWSSSRFTRSSISSRIGRTLARSKPAGSDTAQSS